MRADLEPVLAALLSRGDRALGLDEIGDAIGTMPIRVEDLEALFAELERHGRTIADPAASSVSVTLAVVLATARDLRRERGAVPTPSDIAHRAGMPIDAVRRALLFARVVQR